MASSRIFVRALPAAYTEDEFRSHFSKNYTVTDARLLPQRRIGYVGFKTPEDALSAVKYFNKSFIRTSKIGVELAYGELPNSQSHSLTAKTPRKRDLLEVDLEKYGLNSLKRRRGLKREPSNDPKLEEFLGLMRPPHKLKKSAHKINTNPLGNNLQYSTQGLVLENPGRLLEAAHSTRVGPEKGRATRLLVPYSPAPELPPQLAGEVGLRPHGGTLHAVAPQEKSQIQAPVEVGGKAATDADWMRSRTSRLLGLVADDDGDDNDSPSSKVFRGIATPLAVSKETSSQEPAPPTVEQPLLRDDRNNGEILDEDNLEAPSQAIRDSGRLFLRNLSYSVKEDDLRQLFGSSEILQEVHAPLDPQTGNSKGFAFIQFHNSEDALQAFNRLDGKAFQGRLLHILPAAAKRETESNHFAISRLPLRKQKQIQRKAQASSSTFNWNSLYMNADAVISSISARMGVPKSELLDPSSSDAAVKQAQAETHIIQESKVYFEANGVNPDAFKTRDRSDLAILVKNFQYGTGADDLKSIFSEYGDVSRVLMPPSGTIAIVEFEQAIQARAAFTALAYRKYRDSVLYLEKAPKGILNGHVRTAKPVGSTLNTNPQSLESGSLDVLQESKEEDFSDTCTLFVRNLNFATTSEKLLEVFTPLKGLMSARVKTKIDPKKPGQVLSMGFGFLEFRSSNDARAALAAMNGYNLDGHQLLIKASHKAYDAAEARQREDKARRRTERKSKIVIKNLPFEASKKDVHNLFKSYGHLRAVRMPRKFDNSRKGFAFAEFTTPKEAENAMDALRDTHLLGRRLVLDFATGDVEDPEQEIDKMQQKVGRQSNSVALQRLTASERRKFNVSENSDLDDV